MSLDSLGTSGKRRAILRGVYEDNRKMADSKDREAAEDHRSLLRSVYEENLKMRRRPDLSAKRPARLVRWVTHAALVLAFLLVVLGGFQIYQELQASEPSAGAGRPSAAGVAPPAFVPEGMPAAAAGREAPILEAGVPLANLFGLEVKTIVIDPGHGGRDPGAVGHDDLYEKTVTLDVAQRLRRRLEGHGFHILMTRDRDATISLRDRVRFANEQHADLFISIHVNSLPVEAVNSVETYYFGLEADEQTLKLAAAENRDSDYSNADFRDELEKVGTTMKFQESKQLAGSIQSSLYRNMRRVNGTISNWGYKPGPFVVLLGVEAPSVLAEISVITNKAEASRLRTPDHREKLAASLEAGVVAYLTQQPEPSEPTE